MHNPPQNSACSVFPLYTTTSESLLHIHLQDEGESTGTNSHDAGTNLDSTASRCDRRSSIGGRARNG